MYIKRHVFLGEIEELIGGQALLKGVHHWPSVNRTRIPMAMANRTAPAVNKWWSAMLQPVPGAQNAVLFAGKFSTFFPDHLHSNQIMSSAEQAYLDATQHADRFDRQTGRWWGRDKHGNAVAGFVNSAGFVTTYFP